VLKSIEHEDDDDDNNNNNNNNNTGICVVYTVNWLVGQMRNT